MGRLGGLRCSLARPAGGSPCPETRATIPGSALCELCGGAYRPVVDFPLGTDVIIVVASRAFAAYYALQCVVALRTSDRLGARIAYGALAILLLVITLLAKTAK